MLSLFRNNLSTTFFLLILYAVLLRIVPFIWPIQYVDPMASSSWWLEALGLPKFWLNQLPPQILSLILVVVQAILLNGITNSYRLVGKPSNFVALFYILLAHLVPELLYFSPVLIANTFVLGVLSAVMSSYRQNAAALQSYNAGFFAALATLFYPPYIWLFGFLFFAYILLRGIRLREAMILVLGMATVAIIATACIIWSPLRDVFYEKQISSQLHWPNWIWKTQLNIRSLIALSAFGGIAVFSLVGVLRQINRKDILVQKMLSLQFWLIVFGVLSIIFQTQYNPVALFVLVIPLSILFAVSMSKENDHLVEFFHLAVLIATVFYQYMVANLYL